MMHDIKKKVLEHLHSQQVRGDPKQATLQALADLGLQVLEFYLSLPSSALGHIVTLYVVIFQECRFPASAPTYDNARGSQATMQFNWV